MLAPIADGNTSRYAIAGYVGRKDADIAHPINVLDDAGLIIREPGALLEGSARSAFRADMPILDTQSVHQVDVVVTGIRDSKVNRLAAPAGMLM